METRTVGRSGCRDKRTVGLGDGIDRVMIGRGIRELWEGVVVASSFRSMIKGTHINNIIL